MSEGKQDSEQEIRYEFEVARAALETNSKKDLSLNGYSIQKREFVTKPETRK